MTWLLLRRVGGSARVAARPGVASAWCRWSARPTCRAAARPRARSSASSTIFTGMRCTTLVKLPVALSGGSRANSWPLAGAMLSTWPWNSAREHVDLDLDLLARLHVGELRLLEVRDDVGVGQRNHRHELSARLHILADAQRAVADGAVDRSDDRRVGEVQLGLVLDGFGRGRRRPGPERVPPRSARSAFAPLPVMPCRDRWRRGPRRSWRRPAWAFCTEP